MAKIINPTSGTVVVPLLIEEKQLLALDKVFDDFIQDRKSDDVDAAQMANRHKRSVTIYLAAGVTVKSDRFADAIRQPRTEEPLGLRAHLEIGRVKASVSLTKLVRNVVQPVSPTQFHVVQESQKLEFSVEPADHQSAPELFGALQNWAADFAPSASLRAWARYRPLFMILAVLWLAIGGLLPIVGRGRVVSTDYVYYQDEARKILREGVNDKNQRKAIEIILAIESHNLPEDQGQSWAPGRTYWPRYVFGAAILLMLSGCPTIVIGIWKGKVNLERWRLWTRLVRVGAPGTFFLTIIWPKLLDLLGL